MQTKDFFLVLTIAFFIAVAAAPVFAWNWVGGCLLQLNINGACTNSAWHHAVDDTNQYLFGKK